MQLRCFAILLFASVSPLLADVYPVQYLTTPSTNAFPDGTQVLFGAVNASVNSQGQFVVSEFAGVSEELEQAVADLQGAAFTFNGSVSWNDTIALPASPDGDTFLVQIFSFGGNYYGFSGGASGPGTADESGNYSGISVGGTTYTAACDMNVSPCPTITLGEFSASQIDGLTAIGFQQYQYNSDEPVAGSNPYVAENPGAYESSALITVTRFGADGTPDPFTPTPEPTTYALSGVGIGIVTLAGKRVRRRF